MCNEYLCKYSCEEFLDINFVDPIPGDAGQSLEQHNTFTMRKHSLWSASINNHISWSASRD